MGAPQRESGADVSAWLIAATGLAYFYVACEQAIKGNGNMAGVYLGYAFSNIWLWRLAV